MRKSQVSSECISKAVIFVQGLMPVYGAALAVSGVAACCCELVIVQ